MNLLLKLFSSLVLGTFGILLMTPIVVAQGENDVIIMGTSVWDNCNANIVCEKTSDVSYQCYSTDTTIVGLGGQVHQISVGKSTHAIL